MSTYEKTLIPPLNFSMVDSGVYRSGFPNKKNHAFLQQLGLKSVLYVVLKRVKGRRRRVSLTDRICSYLCHQEHRDENLAFFEANGIQLFQCPIDGNKVWRFVLQYCSIGPLTFVS
jgi:tyrosine-protein phosphatase SIW14